MSKADNLGTFAGKVNVSNNVVQSIEGMSLFEFNPEFDSNYVVDANNNALLVGPINISGNLSVDLNSTLTVFNSVSVTGDLTVNGTMDIR
jgi:hypothetical protein